MSWLTVIILAVAIGLIMMVQEVPIVPFSSMSNEYNIIEVQAPALAGPMLTFFTYVATRTPLRPFIIRSLLNKNEVYRIRQLAASFPTHIPPTYYPMTRLSTAEHEAHVQAAAKTNEAALQNFEEFHSVGPYHSILDYHNIYQSGKATPVQVMEKVLEGCNKLEHLHMFASFHPDQVMDEARASTERWEAGKPLSVFDGVPFAAKDTVTAVGHKVCHGSQNCVDSTSDDQIIANFRQAGAILLGITVSTEGGVTPLGYARWFDGPFNPYDTNNYPGGSSSGSAVVVASGLVPVAIGFDGGGSIRVPAAMSGTYGLATTYGRVETNSALSFTMVKSGTLTASVADAALSHVLMSGTVNRRHFYSQLYDGGHRGVPPAHLEGYRDGVKGMRLGIFWDHFYHSDPEVLRKCATAVGFLESQGAQVVNITIPHLREMHLSHGLKILNEFAIHWDAKFYNSSITLEPNTDITLAMGMELTATEVIACEIIRSFAMDNVRNQIFREKGVDAIVSPTLGTRVPKPKRGYRTTGESNTPLVYSVMRFVPLANLLGLPAMNVPIGYEGDTGLPIGLQLLGDAFTEHKLLRIATVLESGYIKRRTPPAENYFDPLAEF